MTLQVISTDGIQSLLANLMKQGRVVAPHERPGEQQYVFDELKDPADAVLAYTSTVLPPKKYAFPPKETLVHYELGDQPSAIAVADAEPLTVFGVHTCDIYSLLALDVAFADQHQEANYLGKRRNMRIIGIDCEPDEWCFCAAMGTATVDEGYDLFLTPLPDGCNYLLEVATEAGEETSMPTEGSTSPQGEEQASSRGSQSPAATGEPSVPAPDPLDVDVTNGATGAEQSVPPGSELYGKNRVRVRYVRLEAIEE